MASSNKDERKTGPGASAPGGVQTGVRLAAAEALVAEGLAPAGAKNHAPFANPPDSRNSTPTPKEPHLVPQTTQHQKRQRLCFSADAAFVVAGFSKFTLLSFLLGLSVLFDGSEIRERRHGGLCLRAQGLRRAGANAAPAPAQGASPLDPFFRSFVSRPPVLHAPAGRLPSPSYHSRTDRPGYHSSCNRSS